MIWARFGRKVREMAGNRDIFGGDWVEFVEGGTMEICGDTDVVSNSISCIVSRLVNPKHGI